MNFYILHWVWLTRNKDSVILRQKIDIRHWGVSTWAVGGPLYYVFTSKVRDKKFTNMQKVWKFQNTTRKQLIARFTVTGGNEVGVHLVLIQTSLLYYVNHVVLMLISIFKLNFHKKRKEFVSKQAQPRIHSVARTLSPQL